MRPVRRRTQEAFGKLAPVVKVREEPDPDRGMELPAEHGVDHHIEHDVVQTSEARKQPRVAEDHVVQLVHHQQEQIAIPLAVLGQEVRIEQQARCAGALDGCGGHGLAELDVEQAQQFLHLEGCGRQDVEDAVAHIRQLRIPAAGQEKAHWVEGVGLGKQMSRRNGSSKASAVPFSRGKFSSGVLDP